MELKLTARETSCWRSAAPGIKTLRLSAESVIPDSREDLARIVWAQGGLLLKGKELSGTGVTVNGEARCTVLYQTEGEGGLCWLRLQKPFQMDFETESPDEAALPQVRLFLTGLEARALNPRKLAADFTVTAVCRGYSRASLCLEREPERQEPGLHLLRQEREALAVTAVCEKSFTLREQFAPEAGQPVPTEIAGEALRFEGLSAEQIGGRCVVKGTARLEVWGLTGEGEPARLRFSAPFSQLMEPGEVSLDRCALWAEPCSLYLDWVDGPGGRALDAEIHAVVQLTGWSAQKVTLVRDAYSTRAPWEPCFETQRLLTGLDRGSAALTAEEWLPLPEDCRDLLDVQATPGALEQDREGTGLDLSLALLYHSPEGSLCAARRTLRLTGEALPEGCTAAAAELTKLDLRPEEGRLRVRAELAVPWEQRREEGVETLCALREGAEPEPGPGEGPTVFLVRRSGESLWDLAKAYRSSVEAIRARNGEDASLLLITAE